MNVKLKKTVGHFAFSGMERSSSIAPLVVNPSLTVIVVEWYSLLSLNTLFTKCVFPSPGDTEVQMCLSPCG